MYKLFFVLTLFSFAFVNGKIIEIKTMDEVSSYIDKETLVIFDIDNTLLEPIQELGSDQWFYHRIQFYESKGFSSRESVEKALDEWISILHITKVKPVEKQVVGLIKDLQEKGYKVMGLTTRGLGVSTVSIKQLKSIDIDLQPTAPYEKDVFVLNPRGVLFRSGVLFTAGTDKGTSLYKLLDKIRFYPKKICFINDKKSHLVPVEKICMKKQVDFLGLRYSYLDEKVKNFKKEIANIQFIYFGNILSDSEAERIEKEKCIQ